MAGIASATSRSCLLVILLLAVSIGAAGAQGPADQDLLEVTAAFPDCIPNAYSLDAQGRPQGFAFDIMEEVGRRAGLKVNYLMVHSLAEALEAIAEGRAQIIPALSVSAARRRFLDFSPPMMNADVFAFVLKDTHGYDHASLSSLNTGVIAATTAEEFLRELGQEPARRYGTYNEALMELLAGKVDAVVGQEGALTGLARKAKVDHLIQPHGEPVLRTYRAMAVRKGDAALLGRIAPEIEKLVVSPEYRRLYAKWYGEPAPFWSGALLFWTMSGFLVLLLLAMAAWRYTSLRRVNALLLKAVLERGQAQALANAKAEELQLVLDTVPASIWFKDAQNRFLRVNQEAARLLGMAQTEIEGKHARDLFPPWLAEKYHQDDLEVISRLRPKLGIEEQYTKADGSMGWVSTHKAPWQDPQGERFGVLAMSIDITQRKEAEQRLQESEDRFRQMAELLPTAICEVDLDLKIGFLNGAGMHLFGLSPEDLKQGVHIPQLIHPADRPLAMTRIQAMLQGKKFPAREYNLVRKDGGEFTALVAGGPSVHDGSPSGFLYTLTDLSERKKMEQTLRQAKESLEDRVMARTADLAKTNQRLREEVNRRVRSEREVEHALSVISAAFQSTADGIEVVDNLGRMSFFNEKFRAMWSLPVSVTDSRDTVAALDHVLAQLREPEALRERVSRARLLPATDLNFTLELKDGRVFEVHSLPHRLKGKIIGRVWSFRDVTKRLEAEQALRRSEEKHRQVVDNVQEAIVVVQGGALVFHNPQTMVLTGLDRGALPGLVLEQLIHEDDLPSVAEEQKSLLDGESDVGLIEFRLKHHDGTWRWVESRSVLIEWERQPATLQLLSDVTERNAISATLQESMRVLGATLAASPVGIGFTRDQTLLWANAALYELSGYTVKESVGQPTSLLYASEEEYQRVGNYVDNRLSGAEICSFDTRFRRKDGSVIDVYLQTRLLDPADASQGIITAVTDISERKRAEKALLSYQEQLRRLINELNVVEERERRRIASDLHDGLGQDLALMRIKLAAMLGSPGRPGKRELKDILVMIDKALQDAKDLTWDLSAPMLRELGLAPALGWLAEETRGKFGIPTFFSMSGAAIEMEQTLANSLFRMTRELVLNAVKHSKCNQIRISLTFADQRLTLTVEDDGVGFDASHLERHPDKGFGLFNIRGIIDSWGGVAEIESRPGHGSRVNLSAPLLPYLVTGRDRDVRAHRSGG